MTRCLVFDRFSPEKSFARIWTLGRHESSRPALRKRVYGIRGLARPAILVPIGDNEIRGVGSGAQESLNLRFEIRDVRKPHFAARIEWRAPSALEIYLGVHIVGHAFNRVLARVQAAFGARSVDAGHAVQAV